MILTHVDKKITHFGNFEIDSSEFLVGVTTTPTNYTTFLPIMLRIMLTTNITYYAGSSARIIAASLAVERIIHRFIDYIHRFI